MSMHQACSGLIHHVTTAGSNHVFALSARILTYSGVHGLAATPAFATYVASDDRSPYHRLCDTPQHVLMSQATRHPATCRRP